MADKQGEGDGARAAVGSEHGEEKSWKYPTGCQAFEKRDVK